MSLHLLILHRRELTFSYEICLPASGNDQNRVLMMIPFEESTLVRCLGGCVLKSVVLQSDLKSLWHMDEAHTRCQGSFVANGAARAGVV